MLDLHTHSTYSDGTDTPAELARRASEARLRAVALTDHDTMGGAAEFLAACRTLALTGIVGIEISAAVAPGEGTLHILGYGVDPANQALRTGLERVLRSRDSRNRQIVANLNRLGIDLTWEDAQRFAGGEIVGRIHLAMALRARGAVDSIAEAFSRYLGRGAPAYVERYRLTAETVIGLIRQAGGVAALAHPYTWLPDDHALEAALPRLQAFGLTGLEALYAEYDQGRRVALLRLAKRMGLLPLGGSDYHGNGKPGLRLGVGYGDLSVPDEFLPPLLAALGPDCCGVAVAS